MTEVRYGRARAVSPGKHGSDDWRVELGGLAPTHGETVFIVGMCLLAEDRYDGRSVFGSGRYMLWYFLDLALSARTPEAVVALAEDCARSRSERLNIAASPGWAASRRVGP